MGQIPALGKSDQLPGSVQDGGALSRRAGKAVPHQSLLLKGGTIVSMHPATGDLEQGDLLIEGTKITSVALEIRPPAHTQIVDASNTIIFPGFVDSHRHAWEGQLRRILPNAATLGDYMSGTHQFFALHYRPHDMYVGNLVTALSCLDAGSLASWTIQITRAAQSTPTPPFRRFWILAFARYMHRERRRRENGIINGHKT